MLSPSFSTLRCNLRPVAESDHPDLSALYGSYNVRRFLGGPLDSDRFNTKFEAILNPMDGHQWIVRLKETEEFVGMFSLDKHHDGQDTELSYQLAEGMQGKGIGHEICKSLIDFAFNDLHLTRLVSETQTENTASVRLLAKLGINLERNVCRFGSHQSIFAFNDERFTA
jgi:ribosomal-protein-alanine N-acetyltransferase